MSKQPETSLEAKDLKTDESKCRDYDKISSALRVIGEGNYEAIARQMKVKDATVVARRLKEMRELNLLENTGNKTKTSRGRNAFVHKLTELGKNTASTVQIPKPPPTPEENVVKVREHLRHLKKEIPSTKSIQQKLL